MYESLASMNNNLLTYNLPDIEPLLYNESSEKFFTWIPDKFYLVLGRSNSAEKSLDLIQTNSDAVSILKRPSGGETVILSPKTLVLSAVAIEDELKNSHKYFEFFNGKIISILEKKGVKKLNQKGISDISLRDKKILGSSIYRKGNKIFYHAVLNISESVENIEKYILHPTREPDYRKGRKHSEFVTSLNREGYNLNISELKTEFEKNLFNTK